MIVQIKKKEKLDTIFDLIEEYASLEFDSIEVKPRDSYYTSDTIEEYPQVLNMEYESASINFVENITIKDNVVIKETQRKLKIILNLTKDEWKIERDKYDKE